jgi:hypothetical protein
MFWDFRNDSLGKVTFKLRPQEQKRVVSQHSLERYFLDKHVQMPWGGRVPLGLCEG